MKDLTNKLHKTIRQHGAKMIEVCAGSDRTKLILTNDAPEVHGKIQKPYRAFAYKKKSNVQNSEVMNGLEMAYLYDNNISQLAGNKWV